MASLQARVAADIALTKRLTLVACILGSGIALLDGTVVNVALPTIQRALGGGLAAQQWVVQRLPADARLADPGGRVARRPLRRAQDLRARRWRLRRGVAACARSRRRSACWSSARALQGVAGALLVPSSLAVIVNTFPESERGPRDRQLDGVGRRSPACSARSRGGELLAIASWRVDLPDQSAAGGGVCGADPHVIPRAQPAASADGGSTIRARCCARWASAARCSR